MSHHAFLSPLTEAAVYGRDMALVAAENANVTLEDRAGVRRTFVDLVGAYAAVNFGHRNPRIWPFASAQAELTACFMPREAEAYAAWMARRLDLPDHRLLFQVGGAFAVATSIALAYRRRPGRVAVIEGAFHGLDAVSLAATSVQKEAALQCVAPVAELEREVVRLRHGELPASFDDISCVLFEPVQGAAGYVPLDHAWLRELERGARRAGATVIADEIQCGFYRFGALSVARSIGLRPDILLFSKSMTNGLYPFSAVVYDRALEAGFPGAVALAHTFQTSALGVYAAWAVAQFIDSVDVPALVDRVAGILGASGARLRGHPAIDQLHQVGPTMSFGVRGGAARACVQRAFDAGVLIFTGGRHGDRVRIAPPLTIPASDLEAALAKVEAAVSASAP